jgi:hypothetical protein
MLRRPQTAKTASPRLREYKVRLPADLAARVEARAKAEIRPQNRTLINLVARCFDLEESNTLEENLGHLDNMILKYSARIDWQELTEELLRYIDEALNTKGAAHDVAMDKIRAARNAMLKHKAGGSK